MYMASFPVIFAIQKPYRNHVASVFLRIFMMYNVYGLHKRTSAYIHIIPNKDPALMAEALWCQKSAKQQDAAETQAGSSDTKASRNVYNVDVDHGQCLKSF